MAHIVLDIGLKIPYLHQKVEYEVVLFLPYKQVRKIGVECMAFIYVRVTEIQK